MNHDHAAHGLVIAALLIAASFLVQVKQGPFFLGIPLLAFIVFVIAGIMGIRFLTITLRKHQ